MAIALLFIPLIMLIGIISFVFWLIMLIDAITRKFSNDTDKIIWILVILLANLLGALIYYFVVQMKDNKKSMKWFWITLLILVVLIIVLAVATFITSSAVI